MVGVVGFNLNPALASHLRKRREAIERGEVPVVVKVAHTPVPKQRPLSARLSSEQTASIVERYCSGETARSLAAEYGVSLTAMKSLLRKHGAKKS